MKSRAEVKVQPIIVFDMDDTLYDEIDYVNSGFRSVSKFMEEEWMLVAEKCYSRMVDELETSGRGTIFDQTLKHFNIYSKKNVMKCVSVYRNHVPDIQLSDDAKRCLERLKNYSTYVVTDGNKNAQYKKIVALGLTSHVKFTYITYRYGIKHSKPSPYVFLKICEREKVQPGNVVYIGDNLHKDFVGLKPLGFRTVRVLKGAFKDVIKPAEFEAEFSIQTLDELEDTLFRKVFSDRIGVE